MTNPMARQAANKFSLRQLLQAAMANKWEADRTSQGYVLTKDGGVIVLGLAKRPDKDGKLAVDKVRVNGILMHANRTRKAMEAIRGRFIQ